MTTLHASSPSMRGSLVRRGLRRLQHLCASFYWRRKLKAFGTRSYIRRPCFITGGKNISIGDYVAIWRFARIDALGHGEDFRGIQIGEGTKIQPFIHIGAVQEVTIGKGVLIASHVYITDHDHDFSDPFDPPTFNQKLVASPTRIGDYVWLGERVMVLKGVTIGERSIIGAGSIVTKDIPSFSIAIGSPAKVIRQYDQESKAWTKVPS
ncbi:MAG: acyltransferase [Candidatus Omnitrophica bacterium]|nr:acyltransferase [Candidatus Omnitrophota bacterium]